MNHDEITRKIDRRITRRKPETTEKSFAKWESQWDARYGRSKPKHAAWLQDYRHMDLMREALRASRAV